MKAFIYLTLSLVFSCTRYSELSKDDVGLHLKKVQMELTHLKEIEWHVGQRKEATVSQSITFIVDMPKVKEEDLEHLTQVKGVDAWLIRIIIHRGGEKQDLGSVYSPFKTHKILRGHDRAGTPGSVAIKIYYAAAYASERFRNFKCPAFNHRKKIDKMSIIGSNDLFDISINQNISYPEKAQMAELAPSSFNAGHSLIGEYHLEIAAYDSKKKTIYSPFIALPQYVEISHEEEEEVKSCEGIRPEIE
ncbi:MAG: hypothetical protein AB7I27_12965 [Bacteriovoracaceae bacterium]